MFLKSNALINDSWVILQIGLKNMVVDKDFVTMKMVVEETNLIVIQIIVNLLWLFLIYFYFILYPDFFVDENIFLY